MHRINMHRINCAEYYAQNQLRRILCAESIAHIDSAHNIMRRINMHRINCA